MRHCSRLTQSNMVFGTAQPAYDAVSERLPAAQRLYVYHHTAGGAVQHALQERRFLLSAVIRRTVIVQRESG